MVVAQRHQRAGPVGAGASRKSMSRGAGRLRLVVLVCVGALVGAGGVPGVAVAHGPVAPIATSYEARVAQVPAGAEAKVIDGDQRMWLRVQPERDACWCWTIGVPRICGSRARAWL